MRLDPPQTNRVFSRTRTLRAVGAVVCAVVASAMMTGCGTDSDSVSASATSEAAKVVPHQATTSPSPSTSASPARLSEEQQKRKDVLDATKITFDKAAKAAVGAVSGSKLVDLELGGLDDDNASGSPSPSGSASPTRSPSPTGSPSPSGSPSPTGSASDPEWVAEVAEKDGTAHTVRIDAVTGKVLGTTADDNQDADDKSRLVDMIGKATQTPEQAAKVATAKQKGWVTSIGLEENDDDVLVWKVDVVDSSWNQTDFEIDAAKGTIIAEVTEKTDGN